MPPRRRGRLTGLLASLAVSSSAIAGTPAPGAPTVASPTTMVPTSEACALGTAPFAGKIGTYLPESQEAWPDQPKPPADAPNVLIWLIDDAGFGLISAFGGLASTPNLDRLASNGLRYTNFHSTPLCSPSRVSLLTGRNPHAAHMGSHGGTSMGFPGYDGFVPPSAATTAKVLRNRGYSTMALGKWDQTPATHQSPVGPYNLWPLGQGFDHFYGFMWHGTNHFHPSLVKDNSYIEGSVGGDDYYLTTDLADRAIGYVNSIRSVQPDRPFYLYWATGAVHSPHHATQEWRDKYRGRFDMGWDEYRKQVLKRQKAMGLVPEHTEYAPMQEEIAPWDSLSDKAKKLHARQMEAMAAQMSQTDYEFGRIIDQLKRNGQFDNTIIIVTADNGGSPEGGLHGDHLELLGSFGGHASVDENMKHYDEWGGPSTMPHFPVAWTVATNTPFRYYKQTAHDGGHHVPMIVSWPKGIKTPGIRTQYGHIADISPTILEAAGIEQPACVDGVPQQPIDGIALNYSFDNPAAADRRTTQYYELWGNHGIYHDGWKAVVLHKKTSWNIHSAVSFDEDTWELYDVRKDPGETRDLSAQYPGKLAELQRIFEREAQANNVYPLADLGARRVAKSGQMYLQDKRRTVYDYRQPGVTVTSEAVVAPMIGRDYTLVAEFTASPSDEGVLVAAGGVEAGYSLYVKDGKVRYDNQEFGETILSLNDTEPLPTGKSKVELRWKQESRAGGTMALVVNGREAARGQMSPSVFGMHGNNELFNIGMDTGAPAVHTYEAPFTFEGSIQDVTVTLGQPGGAGE